MLLYESYNSSRLATHLLGAMVLGTNDTTRAKALTQSAEERDIIHFTPPTCPKLCCFCGNSLRLYFTIIIGLLPGL